MQDHPPAFITTIPSRALVIWRRLYDRFSLEPGPASVTPDVSKTIVPVTDVGELLKTPTIQDATGDLTGTLGSYVAYFTVPEGERWTIKAWIRAASTVATRIRLVVGGSGANMTLSQTGAQADHAVLWTLDENDSIGMNATADAGDGSIRLSILYDAENAF